ncbi:hypothetical protein WMY93_002278 [Mugilogobius chulae]|uniref:non-specific serine/threonine protein kinase n=1 Tax=Mugilogobius chulae TaxID=88201 RepID=A0AAW0Q414_9GOBI
MRGKGRERSYSKRESEKEGVERERGEKKRERNETERSRLSGSNPDALPLRSSSDSFSRRRRTRQRTQTRKRTFSSRRTVWRIQTEGRSLKFTKKIQDIVLTEAESIGSSAVFECEVSPSTAITSWMKDGSNLREGPKHKFTSDGKDRKLHIIDVQLSDTGEYTCVAKNAGKEVTCSAKLIVEEQSRKDRINVIGMQHAITIQNATEEEAGLYTCAVDGQEEVKTSTNVKVIASATFRGELFKDTPNWKWMKGDTELQPSDKVQIQKDGPNVSLTINNCQLNDVSDYTLEVEDRRYSAKLTLGEREAEVLKPLANVEVMEKEEAHFDTEISEEDVAGEWKLRGQALLRSPTVDIRMEGKKRFLTLKNVQLDQAGEVSYQALNANTTAMLNVKEIELAFVERLKDVSVPENKQAKFEVTLTREVPKVMWFRGQEVITQSPKHEVIHSGTKHLLVINNCQFEDEAQYTVEVQELKSTGQLKVEGTREKRGRRGGGEREGGREGGREEKRERGRGEGRRGTRFSTRWKCRS